MTMTETDFNALSESEQQAVAERLLRIQESGWKPFWCADPTCDGMPHWLLDGQGNCLFVDESSDRGPMGQPVGDRVYEDEDGEWVQIEDKETPEPGWSLLGRPILDPNWAHNHAREDQRLPSWLKPWTLFIMSGRGCVAPWTLIDLADGTRERIDVLAERGEPFEVQTPDGPRWTEGAPFVKGWAHQWRVRLSTGRVLTVTDKHRFLAPGGWLTLDHVRVGQPLVAASHAQAQTAAQTFGGVPSGWREDARRCWHTELGSGCGCLKCRRRGDLPLPQFPETVRETAPPRADAGERSQPWSDSGDRVGEPAGIRACRRSNHQTRSRSSLVGLSPGDGRSHDESGLVGSSPRSPEIASPSLLLTDLAQPKPVGLILREELGDAPCLERSRPLRATASQRSAQTHQVQLRGLARSESPLRSERSDLVWVESVEYSHFGPFYDMTVPGPSSYISEGVVNHNSGKTRTGVEFVTLCARKGLNGAILGRRGTELVNTHVAEILAHAHPEFTPVHWASKDILEWPNGAITYLFSAEKPENIRSVNLSYAWVDEAAFMDEIGKAWTNLKLATRIETPGNPIHFLITSTPTGSEWVVKMEDDPDVIVRRVSTYANRANLSESFLEDLRKEHEGTRIGRQEIHGEVLRDVEGALWNDDLFKHERCNSYQEFVDWLESMDDRVIAVDPAGSANKRSDLTGIIGMGAQHFDDTGSTLPASTFTMLGDATLKGTPSEWAERVYSAARLMRANRIIAEKNFGGDMVKQVLTDWAKLNPEKSKNEDGEDFKIEVVHAQTSKETRAEATVGKYEQGRVTHLISDTAYGDLSKVEKEMVLWVPKSRGGRQPSPNRIDATVWAVRALEAKIRVAAQQATSRDVMTKLKRPGTM